MSYRSHCMKTFVCVVAVLLAATSAAAQTTTADIHGTVFDPNQAVIVGAALTFTDKDAESEFSAKTNAEGAFKVVLPAGYYEVTVHATNFAPARRFVDLCANSSVLVNVRLEVQGSYDPIVVVDEAEVSTSPPGSPRQLPEIPPSTPGISVIKFVAPVYPHIARTARIQGEVRVLVEIAPDGSAKSATVIEGHPMLTQAAADSVKQWKFGCQRCDPPLHHVVTISFTLPLSAASTCLWSQGQCIEPALPSRVTVAAFPAEVTIDDAWPLKRSLRCLFLYRCSLNRWR